MGQPRAYTRTKNFTENFGSETDHSALNAELDAAGNSINDIRDNIAIIQADDGKLRPAVVTPDSISPELRASLVEGVTADTVALVDAAQTSATAAASSATVATSQANLATLNGAAQVALATTQAGLATTNGAAQVALATTQAGNAATSATAAASSATAAAGSATAAAGSANSAAASAAASVVPAGTKMLFIQTAAPTGWTKDTTHNDKALRIVSGAAGSGGTAAFSTVMASRTPGGTVGGTTLTIAQMPSHDHVYQAQDGIAPPSRNASGSDAISPNNKNTSLTGGNGSHTHSFTGTAMDFAVQYVDSIIATKN